MLKSSPEVRPANASLVQVPLEKDIQKTLIDYCKLRGHLVVKFLNVGIMKPDGSRIPVSQRGVSDLLVCRKGTGQFCAIEVKRPGGKATAEQLAFIADVVNAGGIGIVATSIEDVQRAGI